MKAPLRRVHVLSNETIHRVFGGNRAVKVAEYEYPGVRPVIS